MDLSAEEIKSEEIPENYYRYLTVDNHLFIPTEVSTRVLVSSADVLHS